MSNTISAVGTLASAYVVDGTTLSVTPTAVGDAFVFCTQINSTSVDVASVADSNGAMTWSRIVSPYATGLFGFIDMWLGVVIGHTGTATTITITPNGTLPPSSHTTLLAQEFTCTGANSSTIWQADHVGTITNSSSTNVTFPTLTPTLTSDAYVGYALVQQTGSASGGTSGYTIQLDPATNPYIYDPAVTGVQSPIAIQGPAGTSAGVGALINASQPAPPATGTGAFFPFFGC